MVEQNPYQILGVPQSAGMEEIEDAYDALYDSHEAAARSGDGRAIGFLNALNTAREALVDPQQRAALDAGLGSPSLQSPVKTAPQAPVPTARKAQQRTQATAGAKQAATAVKRPGAATSKAPSPTITTRKRSPSMTVAAEQGRSMSRMLWLSLAGAGLVLAALFVVYLLIQPKGLPAMPATTAANMTVLAQTTGTPLAIMADPAHMVLTVTPDASRGEIMATVDGVPVYQDDWQIRLNTDKSGALSDPMFAPFVNNFQGITGTRILDGLSYDALDKLVNLEMIQQQAAKEGMYPTASQQQGLIAQAKQNDLANGQTFSDFLKKNGITEAQYNRTVVQNIVYTVMANAHIPKTGSDDDKTSAWTNWICDTRRSYNVLIYHKFILTTNKPCTSGLPTDLPLPGVSQATPPDAVATP